MLEILLRVGLVFAAAAVLAILGFTDVVFEMRRLARRLKLTVDYQNRWFSFFRDYRQGSGSQADYAWLTENLGAITAELGPENRIVYRAPMGAFVDTSYALLDNALAAVRTDNVELPAVDLADHNLIAHGGALKHRISTVEVLLNNPVALVFRGIRLLVSLPLLLLVEIGLLRSSTLQKAQDSWLFRFVQFMASAALAAAAVVTIVVGWSAFIQQLANWLP